jgi:hypothetical protein
VSDQLYPFLVSIGAHLQHLTCVSSRTDGRMRGLLYAKLLEHKLGAGATSLIHFDDGRGCEGTNARPEL